MSLLQNALLIDPLNANIFYEIGGANESLQDWDAARAGYERSLQIEPDQPNAFWGFARIGLQTGDILSYLENALKMIEVDPNDHEGPGLLARYLYELGLIEEGDQYQSWSTTMAPTSNLARRNKLVRAIVINEEGESVALARQMVEDDIGDRRFAWQEAVRHLTRVAARRGTAAEAFAFLDTQIPGFSDIGSPPGSMKIYDGRFVTAGARIGLVPEAEIQLFLDEFVDTYRLIGDDILSRPQIHVEYLAIRGDTSAAIEVALRDYFSEPVTAHINWQRIFSSPYMAEVGADPRVQAELTRWDNEMAVMRGQVREYLRTHSGGI
jgi:tetratricopeptide (TPR) repeat protein